MSKTGGTTGTNQYRVKGSGKTTMTIPAMAVPNGNSSVGAPDSDTQRLVDFALTVAQTIRRNFAKEPALAMLDLPECPPQVIRQLAMPDPHLPHSGGAASNPVLAAAIQHTNCPPDVLEYGHTREGGSFDIKVAFMRRGGQPASQWRKIARGKSAQSLAALGVSAACPDEIKRQIWPEIADSPYVCSYAKRVHITPAIVDQVHEMAKMISSDGRPVSISLASNPTCPPEVLSELLAHGEQTRRAVLANPQCPEHIRAIGALAR